MKTIEMMILGIFDHLAFLLMILAILRREPTTKKQGILFLLLATLWMVVMIPVLPRGLYVLSIIFCYGTCVHFIYRKKIVSTLIMTAISITAVVVFSSLIIFLLSSIFNDISTNFLLGLVAQTINLLICLSLYLDRKSVV